MAIKYQKVWDTMNDLEMIIAKVVSAREMIDVANECCSNNQQERAEAMTMAAYEFLGYFIEEFDEKFKLAWQATVGDLRDGDVKNPLTCDKDDPSPECKDAWNSFWESTGSTVSSVRYTDEELNAMCDAAEKQEKADKVVKWQLPVELEPSGECFVTFPDDLLEAANLKEGDQVEWVDNGDGSYTLTKVSKPLGMDEC
jgi:hypothetical protein